MLDDLRKKLIFRSWHRGTREMDLVMGRFADAHVAGMNADELRMYEELLTENDPDLYNWLTGKELTPERCDHAVMRAMCDFHMGEKK